MPAFSNFDDSELYALVEFLVSGSLKKLPSSGAPTSNMKYRFTGYHRFLTRNGYPPSLPVGTLSAINLNTVNMSGS